MKIIELSPKKNFRLHLRFENGIGGEVDLSSYAGRGVFAAWLKPGVFEKVTLAETGHPEWPGGIDLCPDALFMRLTGKSPEAVFPVLRKPSVHA